MKKSKKIIVYLCLFFLSFSIVTDFKRQETQAIALVDDALLWAFGMLVLGTGVVAIKDIQVPHMGSLVLDNLKSSGVSEEEFLIKSADGVLKGVKIYDKVLNAVNSVVDSFTGDTVLSEPYPYTSGEFTVSASSFPVVRWDKNNPYDLEKFYNTSSKIMTFHSSGPFVFDGKLIDYVDRNYAIVSCNTLVNSIPTNRIYIFSLGPNNEVWSWTYSSDSSTVRVIPKTGTTFSNLDNYTYIPYSNPVVKENYNPTYTDQNLPYTAEKPGFIPLPTDTIMDKPISTELPLTWDDVKGGVIDLPVDDTIPGEDTGEGEIETPSGWGWLLDILKSILNAILSIPGAILDFFEIDWTLVGEHVVYDEIFKTKFKPFYDVIYLLQNINVNPSTHSGKFYMVIPPEMGGDGQEHCVLDLTVGNEYIVMARAFINASIWIGFLWYIIKLFSPNLDIG